METVLKAYAKKYDKAAPVVCIDEKSV